MDAPEFYRRVQQHARLASVEEAHGICHDVLSSMADVISVETANELMNQLPPDLGAALHGGGVDGPDELVDKEVFVGRLMNHVDTEFTYDQTLGGLDLISVYSGDEVARRAQSVFAVLKEAISPHTARAVESALPGEVAHWFRNAEPGPIAMGSAESGLGLGMGLDQREPRLKY